MGLTDLLADLYAALPFTVADVHAEAPSGNEEDDATKGEEDKEAMSKGKGGPKLKGGEEGEDDGGEGEDRGEGEGESEGGDDAEAETEAEAEEQEEEEEEEEDEPVDPKPKLEAECANSAQCAPMKHHFDECVERVHAQHNDAKHKGPTEDCTEEFFHLQHCATQCAAPKLFRQLK